MFYSPLLPVHITGGVLGILSGTVAMIYRKGSPRTPWPARCLWHRCW